MPRGSDSFNDVLAFVHVVREGSFTRAAALLGLVEELEGSQDVRAIKRIHLFHRPLMPCYRSAVSGNLGNCAITELLKNAVRSFDSGDYPQRAFSFPAGAT